MGQDPRKEITIAIDGHEIPMLYDTGAAATCLTLKTFLRYFPNAQRLNHQTKLVGAGNNNLDLYGIYYLPATYKGQSARGTFMVCQHLEQDILGIDLINDLGLSYDAKTQQVFAISRVPDTLVVTSQTTIQPFSTAVVFAQFKWTAQPSGHNLLRTTPEPARGPRPCQI